MGGMAQTATVLVANSPKISARPNRARHARKCFRPVSLLIINHPQHL
jgi:hypothetical protein